MFIFNRFATARSVTVTSLCSATMLSTRVLLLTTRARFGCSGCAYGCTNGSFRRLSAPRHPSRPSAQQRRTSPVVCRVCATATRTVAVRFRITSTGSRWTSTRIEIPVVAASRPGAITRSVGIDPDRSSNAWRCLNVGCGSSSALGSIGSETTCSRTRCTSNFSATRIAFVAQHPFSDQRFHQVGV